VLALLGIGALLYGLSPRRPAAAVAAGPARSQVMFTPYGPASRASGLPLPAPPPLPRPADASPQRGKRKPKP
jgi:hypothetical protein